MCFGEIYTVVTRLEAPTVVLAWLLNVQQDMTNAMCCWYSGDGPELMACCQDFRRSSFLCSVKDSTAVKLETGPLGGDFLAGLPS